MALLHGARASLFCFALGDSLFGASQDNWFVSVGEDFRAQPTEGLGFVPLSLMFTLAG